MRVPAALCAPPTPFPLAALRAGVAPAALEAGASGAWLLLSERAQLCLWASVPAESAGSHAMPGAALDLTLVAPQLAGGPAPPRAAAAFVSRPTSRSPGAQAVVCAGMDVEGGESAPYAMAYDATTRNVIWSTWLEAPPDAIAAAAGKAARCALVRAPSCPAPSRARGPSPSRRGAHPVPPSCPPPPAGAGQRHGAGAQLGGRRGAAAAAHGRAERGVHAAGQ